MAAFNIGLRTVNRFASGLRQGAGAANTRTNRFLARRYLLRRRGDQREGGLSTCRSITLHYTSGELRRLARDSISRAERITRFSAKRWSTETVVGVKEFGEGVTPRVAVSFVDPRWKFQSDQTLQPTEEQVIKELEWLQDDLYDNVKRRIRIGLFF